MMEDNRLDTNMTVTEAISRAAKWWDKTGRHLMRKDGPAGLEKAFSLDPDSENFIQSGILNGVIWDGLNKREKLFIVKAWHHVFIRSPQQIGE